MLKVRGKCIASVLAVGIGAIAVTWWVFSQQDRPVSTSVVEPQCGHWTVLRVCELLGAPVDLPSIIQMLPPDTRGHSMAAVASIVAEIGLTATGRRESRKVAELRSFPCIAHLQKPEDHFVVVATVDEGQVHLFDCYGRRSSQTIAQFEERWSGNVLYVQRDPEVDVLPRSTAGKIPGPRVQFETLFVDHGNLPYSSEPVLFSYAFTNLGSSDLVIRGLYPDCTCLQIKKPDGPIRPAETGVIEAVYHLEAKEGPFFHQVVIETNDVVNPTLKLKAAGFVDRGVVVFPSTIQLSDVVPGRLYSGMLCVRYKGDLQSFEVGRVSSDVDGVRLTRETSTSEVLASRWPGIEEAGAVPGMSRLRAISYHYRVPEEARTDVNGEVVIETNVKGFVKVIIPLTARVKAHN